MELALIFYIEFSIDKSYRVLKDLKIRVGSLLWRGGSLLVDPHGSGTSRQSISRVRDNMMARLHEAAGHPMSNETMADTGDEDKDGDGRREEEKAEIMGGENGNASNENENLDVRAGRAGSMEGGWVEETVEHPAPDYGLSSPVIR